MKGVFICWEPSPDFGEPKVELKSLADSTLSGDRLF